MEFLPSELLHKVALPDLAAALGARTTPIIERWEMAVRDKLPHAEALTLKQLRNHLPNALRDMTAAIGMKNASQGDLKAHSAEHGEMRFHQEYNLGELLLEYSVLRPILIEEVQAQLARPLTIEEIDTLNAAIDIAVRRATLAFVDHQKTQLQSAVEMHSKYLSFLSHDLRGGLNGILLMIEVLRRELKSEERFAESVEDLESMRRSILDTVATMDRFLNAERFRKGKVVVRLAEIDLASIVREVVTSVSYQAREKGINIEQSLDGSAKITSDRELLMMVLQNLMGNAIKYDKGGKVHIGIKSGAEGRRIIFISDTGPGIAQDKIITLFAPYTRGETQGQPGVGLGLSIARQAADLLGAKLWVESELGKGATFFIELPDQPPTVATPKAN